MEEFGGEVDGFDGDGERFWNEVHKIQRMIEDIKALMQEIRIECERK